MKGRGAGGMVRKAVLPELAFLFRQLSLFDKTEELQPPIEPTVGAGKPATGTVVIPENPSHAFQDLCRGPYAHVEVRVKPRMWENWRVFWTRRKESLRVEIPSLLETAPLEVKVALLQWAILVSRRGVKQKPELRLERVRLETLIRGFLRAPAGDQAAGPVHARLRARNRRRLERMAPQGRHHDLALSFGRVNARYFEGNLQATVTWSARLGGLSTHTMAQDGEGRPYHLITISRGYDNPEVTPEILDGVMYHECLHIAIPPEHRNGRRIVHGPDFRKREREYEHFETWRKWHRDGLPAALKRMRRLGL